MISAENVDSVFLNFPVYPLCIRFVLIPQKHAASLTAAAAKKSSGGGAASVPVPLSPMVRVGLNVFSCLNTRASCIIFRVYIEACMAILCTEHLLELFLAFSLMVEHSGSCSVVLSRILFELPYTFHIFRAV